MRKLLFNAFVVSLFIVSGFMQPADALVLGPIDANGLPAWIGDGADANAPGLQLQPCLAPKSPAGPCIAHPGEIPFWSAEVIPAVPPAPLTDLRFILAIGGEKLPAAEAAELGLPRGVTVMTALIRLRLDGGVANGNYVFSTPFGPPFSLTADAAGKIDAKVVDVIAPPPAFAELQTQPIQQFLRAAIPQTSIDPETGQPAEVHIGFIGDGITEMDIAGGSTFSISGDGIAPADPAATFNKAVFMGKIFAEPGATAVLNGPPRPMTIDVTAATGTTVVPTFKGVQFPSTPLGTPITVRARTPKQVAVIDGATPPGSIVVTNVQDTVTIKSAAFNRAGALVVKASSNMTPAPTLTITDANGTVIATMKKAKTVRAAKLPAGFTAPITVTSTAGGSATADVTPAP